MRKLVVSTITILCLSAAQIGFPAQKYDMDLIRMKTGSLVEGSISGRTETHLTVECMGGRLLLPFNNIEKITEALPGESELALGLQLMEREKYDRAREFLFSAQQFASWRSDAQDALQRIEQVKKEKEQQQLIKQRKEIENIIAARGMQAGIAELQRRHKANLVDNDYWGKYRGRMHLIMARERIDHLDIRGAERHLALADQYGADAEDYKAVQEEIAAMRDRRILLPGRRSLAIRPNEDKRESLLKPRTYTVDDWLAAVEQARLNGERVPPREYLSFVERYARENQLDPLLVWAMIDTESSWRPKVVSSAGAQGLMQLMPGTAGDMDVSDPFNPEENIKGGTQYMRLLLTMFNDLDKALAAYNMGPGTIGRAPEIPEAGQRYINKVKTRYAALQSRFSSRT
ncbi:MAG: lytic transglycosylase domain-containing protein [bacterium]|jgi:hypothetical protein